ncbi:DsbD_2 domain-containing protein [Candidatus Hydrogenisulfobacillus filiaventi]|uniref:DsbD_2 domain-containing protein n=1 Tax=Candidatus Hydrogenisulfobacillus filiaventi TaxID=2707344 RepID=A0A6F8ZFG9_9FIRM|nr:hypothetical protein [Bacillota bacterium]CAB1128621.1 DsbD_2 domain-containing protein [Candidatus Hydrogenisulfobacillus filiaventi]
MLNLWDPHAGLAVGAALATAFLLGMVHGITPDEHTWPITFSYAIGSYSTRKGLLAGLIFSLAFTLQRALASELAYLALDRWFTMGPTIDYVVYLLVGAAMAVAGFQIMRGRHWHLFGSHRAGPETAPDLQDPRPWMPAVHGFIAGWGFGAFAILIYTVLAPAMPDAALGWLPGALFGLGTMTIQASAGALFGWVSRRLGLDPAAVRRVALITAGRTLGWGGLVFVAGGVFGLLFPGLAGFSLATGLHIHNLDHLGIALVLVMVTVLGIGLGTLISQTRYWARQARTAGTAGAGTAG